MKPCVPIHSKGFDVSNSRSSGSYTYRLVPIGVSTDTVIEKLYIDEAPLTFESDYTNENAKSCALTYTELSS